MFPVWGKKEPVVEEMGMDVCYVDLSEDEEFKFTLEVDKEVCELAHNRQIRKRPAN